MAQKVRIEKLDVGKPMERHFIEKNEKEYDFENGQDELPKMFLVAYLTDKPIKTGFPWCKSGANTKIIRPTDKPIWIVEKRAKESFLSRLFGGKQ